MSTNDELEKKIEKKGLNREEKNYDKAMPQKLRKDKRIGSNTAEM